jgi:hypothetical protein
MNPKKGNLYFRAPGIKIFLDDIEKIIEIMGDGVEISDDSSEYESPKELKQKIKLTELNLQKYSPHISLYFKKGSFGGGSLFADAEAKLQFLELKELLLQKRRWFSFLSSDAVFYAGAIAFVLSFVLIFTIGKLSPHSYFSILLGILPIISISLIFACYLFQTGYFTSIDLNYSYKKQSLWVRYGDQILIASIGAVIGTVIGGVMMWAILKFLD